MQKARPARPVRPTRRKKSQARRWTIVIIIGIIVGALGGYAFQYVSRVLSLSNTSLGQVLAPPFHGKTFFRVLILGEDNTSKKRANGRGLSDTIMVAAINLDSKTVHAVSVPRDTMVELEGHGTQKINAAHVFGGPELTRETVQSLLGLDNIDYYVKTDIEGLTKIVDLLGGVGIDVEKDMHYTDRHGGLYINLKKGYRWLDGNKALGYVRFRHDRMGDISRTERQQKFLRALARQMMQPRNWTKLLPILQEIKSKGYVETDMNLKDLSALAKLAGEVPQEKIQTETLPGAPVRIGGISYWEIDREKTAEIVTKLLDYPTATASSAPNAKVEVLNGSGIAGLAKTVADKLQQSGFEISSTGNAQSFDYESCQIIIHNPAAGGVQNIADAIGCKDIKRDGQNSGSSGADVTVIVGRDYRP